MINAVVKKLRNVDEIRQGLDENFKRYHHPKWIGTDPIKFVHAFSEPRDQEIVGLIAASLAYGNVTTINASVQRVLHPMNQAPYSFLMDTQDPALFKIYKGFRHRWTGERAIIALIAGMRRVIKEHGSLGEAFILHDDGDPDITKPLARWVRLLKSGHERQSKDLLSDPERNSACKRLHLYLRWMVRKDGIDLGCWRGVTPNRLLIPLDTHVYRFARACRFTDRKGADRKTTEEITGVFRVIAPDDPVKYDFSLTRPGIIDGWLPTVKTPWKRAS